VQPNTDFLSRNTVVALWLLRWGAWPKNQYPRPRRRAARHVGRAGDRETTSWYAALLVTGGVFRVRVEPGDWVSASPFWREEPGQAPLPPALAIWVELARVVKPGVATVSTTQRTSPRGGPEDFSRRFFGEPEPGSRARRGSLISGLQPATGGVPGLLLESEPSWANPTSPAVGRPRVTSPRWPAPSSGRRAI